MLLLSLCVVTFCGGLLRAQDQKTITIRMLDSKTGLLIPSSSYLVRINHQQEVHGAWVVQSDDGTGKLTLPAEADTLLVHATYEYATQVYVNCDTDKDHGSSEHAPGLDHWYPVAQILASGVAAPNDCAGKKIPERLQVVAKPGEFVFFVRHPNTMERFKE
jgi:hypothetical protein